MKGKVLSIITAVLFGATMVASPILYAAPTDTTGAAGMEEQKAPAEKAPKKKSTKKKAVKKKVAKKKASKKKSSKKKSEEKAPAAMPE